MPEAMLPAIMAVVCSERGRSERAGARGEHGVNYGDIDGLLAAAAGGWLLCDQELMDPPLPRWPGRRPTADLLQRAMLRTLVARTRPVARR